MSKKPSLTLPDDESIAREEERREKAEHSVGTRKDGRFIPRKPKRVQIGLKTSEAIRGEWDRLRELSEKSYTDMFEEAVADLAKKYAKVYSK